MDSNRPPVGPPASEIAGLVRRYLSRFETLGWNRFEDFAWDKIEGERLSEPQLDALRTAMLVEDHIPGYSKAYCDLFALDPSFSENELALRRQMLHFVARWVYDEDRHAHTLENYMRACGRYDARSLDAEMLKTVAVPYAAPHPENAMQMAVYTVIQEKATQVFYSCLRDAVTEPVLKDVLNRLSQDEARHCGFFVDLFKIYLAVPGGVDYAKVKEAVVAFKMPLYGTLDNYKRRSITMMRAAEGYHFRDAFGLIEQAVTRYADAAPGSRSHTVEDLLATLSAISDPTAARRRAAVPAAV
ncbi:MAG: acyl-ACP desaturase [Elusimicrobia bacterium]|nr:acyl-ACP desaturase [Elusimicrobiota bacterium]